MRADDVDEVGLPNARRLELSPCRKDGRLEHDGGGRAEILDVAERGHVGFCELGSARRPTSDKGEERTSAALQSRRQQLEDPTHLLDLLDDSGPDEDGANLNRRCENLGVRVGSEGGSEGGGDGGLVLVEEESFFKVEVLGLAKVLRVKRAQ